MEAEQSRLRRAAALTYCRLSWGLAVREVVVVAGTHGRVE